MVGCKKFIAGSLYWATTAAAELVDHQQAAPGAVVAVSAEGETETTPGAALPPAEGTTTEKVVDEVGGQDVLNKNDAETIAAAAPTTSATAGFMAPRGAANKNVAGGLLDNLFEGLKDHMAPSSSSPGGGFLQRKQVVDEVDRVQHDVVEDAAKEPADSSSVNMGDEVATPAASSDEHQSGEAGIMLQTEQAAPVQEHLPATDGAGGDPLPTTSPTMIPGGGALGAGIHPPGGELQDDQNPTSAGAPPTQLFSALEVKEGRVGTGTKEGVAVATKERKTVRGTTSNKRGRRGSRNKKNRRAGASCGAGGCTTGKKKRGGRAKRAAASATASASAENFSSVSDGDEVLPALTSGGGDSVLGPLPASASENGGEEHTGAGGGSTSSAAAEAEAASSSTTSRLGCLGGSCGGSSTSVSAEAAAKATAEQDDEDHDLRMTSETFPTLSSVSTVGPTSSLSGIPGPSFGMGAPGTTGKKPRTRRGQSSHETGPDGSWRPATTGPGGQRWRRGETTGPGGQHWDREQTGPGGYWRRTTGPHGEEQWLWHDYASGEDHVYEQDEYEDWNWDNYGDYDDWWDYDEDDVDHGEGWDGSWGWWKKNNWDENYGDEHDVDGKGRDRSSWGGGGSWGWWGPATSDHPPDPSRATSSLITPEFPFTTATDSDGGLRTEFLQKVSSESGKKSQPFYIVSYADQQSVVLAVHEERYKNDVQAGHPGAALWFQEILTSGSEQDMPFEDLSPANSVQFEFRRTTNDHFPCGKFVSVRTLELDFVYKNRNGQAETLVRNYNQQRMNKYKRAVGDPWLNEEALRAAEVNSNLAASSHLPASLCLTRVSEELDGDDEGETGPLFLDDCLGPNKPQANDYEEQDQVFCMLPDSRQKNVAVFQNLEVQHPDGAEAEYAIEFVDFPNEIPPKTDGQRPPPEGSPRHWSAETLDLNLLHAPYFALQWVKNTNDNNNNNNNNWGGRRGGNRGQSGSTWWRDENNRGQHGGGSGNGRGWNNWNNGNDRNRPETYHWDPTLNRNVKYEQNSDGKWYAWATDNGGNQYWKDWDGRNGNWNLWTEDPRNQRVQQTQPALQQQQPSSAVAASPPVSAVPSSTSWRLGSPASVVWPSSMSGTPPPGTPLGGAAALWTVPRTGIAATNAFRGAGAARSAISASFMETSHHRDESNEAEQQEEEQAAGAKHEEQDAGTATAPAQAGSR
ncbi:unnamed protein product [Amoebophrya sp. A120]|nr:unnamed protein product [Amoebophrya sp. A120]|eukprot:GSA120T00003545001.1